MSKAGPIREPRPTIQTPAGPLRGTRPTFNSLEGAPGWRPRYKAADSPPGCTGVGLTAGAGESLSSTSTWATHDSNNR